MRKYLLRRPSPSLVISMIALFVALGGAAYAANGGNFILGFPNNATATTSLTSNNAGKALNVTQQSAGTGATALGLNVPSGKTPFTVNSGVKVANLNADKLDGLNSTDFLRTNGSAGGDLSGPFSNLQLNPNTVTGAEVADNSLTDSDIALGTLFAAGYGSDTACFADAAPEVCANVSVVLPHTSNVLMNATGQWRTFSSPPDSMVCQLRVDGSNVGLAQSFGENGSNHTGTQADGTMALTALTGALAAGSHAFDIFCTQTDADIDLLNNQLTVSVVDDGGAALSVRHLSAAEAAKDSK